MMAEIQDSTIA